MKPTIGRIVHYTLTDADAAAINVRRTDFDSYRAKHAAAQGTERAPGAAGRTGHMAHVGNNVAAGDIFPALVVRDWDTAVGTVNLQLFLDGSDSYWATSRLPGDQPGQWQWPPEPGREPGDRPARF